MNASDARQMWTAAAAPFQDEMLWYKEPNHLAYEKNNTRGPEISELGALVGEKERGKRTR